VGTNRRFDISPQNARSFVLADIINSGAVPVARLTEIFRQAAESQRTP
jgi:hypothetical protein